jgi:hypothetical protein
MPHRSNCFRAMKAFYSLFILAASPCYLSISITGYTHAFYEYVTLWMQIIHPFYLKDRAIALLFLCENAA